MKIQDFTSKAAGIVIKTAQNYHAFLPSPLPPRDLKPDWVLTKLLSEADSALSELNGIAKVLPSPQILIAPVVRKEAVLSSRIENTQAGMEDLYLFELDGIEQVSDVREVANYVKALEHGIKRLKELPICTRLIKELHEILMDQVRGHHYRAGEFRTTQNWIGPPGCTLTTATYIPPPPNEMHECLSQLEKYLNEFGQNEPTLIKAALLHYQFEATHPFPDGNGRVGRLLIALYLCSENYLAYPVLYLSAFFEHYRDDYYRRLLAVSQKGEWKEWIEFFLRGVATQAKAGINLANSILALQKKYRATLGTKRVPEAAVKLIDYIFENPIISPAKLSAQWNLTFPSVMSGIERLIKAGILEEMTGQKRNRLYCAREIVNLLNENYIVNLSLEDQV